MELDPRCVGFEGRLHADRRTAEYVGRANHENDAACFRSSRAVHSSSLCGALRLFYFETQILATNSSTDTNNNSRANSSRNSRHAGRNQDLAATIARDWRRRAELQAMDLEDVHTGATNGNGAVDNTVNFAFTLSSRTLQQMRTRHERRRLRRSNERKKYSHKVAVGFLLDDAEVTTEDAKLPGYPPREYPELLESRLSRRAVKQLMQRVLSDTTMSGGSDDDEEKKQRRKSPSVSHRELGKAANTLAYVGSTGRVISHGREFLQCERYGVGDVVGCGVLLDTNTFFFTLNGRLMGMLEAKDVYDLDDFGETFESDDAAEEGELENYKEEHEEVNGAADKGENGVGIQLNDVDMEDVDVRVDEDKVLYPSVSLHGAGECVHTIFKSEEFQFDLPGFEKQVQKERQRALLEEREKRAVNGSPDVTELMESRDEAAMNELVQDFFLHYGYENAYKAFEEAVAPSRDQQPSDAMDVNSNGGGTSNGNGHVEDMEDEEKCDDTESVNGRLSLYSPKKQHLHSSLRLRHDVRDRICQCQTTEALALLDQNTPAFMKNGKGSYTQQFRKLMLYCRILCVVDVLTKQTTASSTPTNGKTTTSRAFEDKQEQNTGWNSELAIEYAQQLFGSSSDIVTNGKRKRQGRSGSSEKSNEVGADIALVMSLLLYDRRESVPATSHALKFLTLEFRESVADQINSLLLIDEALSDSPPVSSLETFIKDLGDLQKECLHNGCRVYPDSVATVSTGKCKSPQNRRRSSLSSSSDDSSSSSQSEQDGRLDDEDDDDDE